MSGRKLFLVITSAVACGMAIAFIAYGLFFSAAAYVDLGAGNTSQSATSLSAEDQAFVNAVGSRQRDEVKTLLGKRVNWQTVATPALLTSMRTHDLGLLQALATGGTDRYYQQELEFWTGFDELLVKNGADVNAAIVQESTTTGPLRFLVAHGANVNAIDGKGRCPLEVYAETDSEAADLHDDCVAYLISVGANVNAADMDGNTPLHVAAKSNACKEIHRLIDAGANVNAKNKNGQTPLGLANITLSTDAAALLKASGASE